MAFLLVASFASPTTAATISNERPLLFSFSGSDSSIGGFTRPLAMAIDESTGDVYVLNLPGSAKGPGPFDSERVVCKFDAEGHSQTFSSTGESCLSGASEVAFGTEGFPGSQSDVAVDNSGGGGNPGEGEQGRIYVSEGSGPIHAFSSTGAHLFDLSRITANPCGIAVDHQGNLWVGDGEAEDEKRFKVLEFDSSGSLINSVAMTHGTARTPCHLAIDKSGDDIYVELPSVEGGIDKYVGGVYDSTLADASIGQQQFFDVYVDQSTSGNGHILFVKAREFAEFEPCATAGCAANAVPGSPFGRDLISAGHGIAYNPDKDWVYISDDASDTVKVFGPVTSGTAPDVSVQKTEPVGLHTVTAHGTINPLSLPNSNHFEWKPCASVECASSTDASWGTAESGFFQSIEPSDSNSHSLSHLISEYHGKRLRSNTWFQVRLVGTNTENHLSSYSNPDSFKTTAPPPAAVENCSVSAIGSESAHIACTINPQEDETTWSILYKALPNATQAKCEVLSDSEFTKAKEGLDSGEHPGSSEVATDLAGLLPAQAYCIRAVAANPGNPPTQPGKKDLTFNSRAVPPSEVSTAYAAPRTDTTTRINGRVNPNGEAAITGGVTYQFEISIDGISWTPLAVLHSSVGAREPIVLADELNGLQPNTTYHYRFGLVENSVGSPVDPAGLGKEKTFTTRSAAETEEASPPKCPNEDVRAIQHSTYLGSCRGIELVNNPDKGNQAVSSYSGPGEAGVAITADGNKALWRVLGGAPGAPNGTQSAFLTERLAGGWQSQSINPPAEKQTGGGSLAYILRAATPDFSAFAVATRLSTANSSPPPPFGVVRIRPGEEQEALMTTEAQVSVSYTQTIELSDDGRHVLVVNPQTQQLEDVGNPEAPKILSILPDGSQSACGLSTEGDDFGHGKQWHVGYHGFAVADDSLVYFRAKPNKPAPNNTQCEASAPSALYERNLETEKTIMVDAGTASHPLEVIRVTPDGQQVYYATYSHCRRFTQLIPASCEALESADTNNAPDVYRWDGRSEESTCLTCAVSGEANVAEFNGGPSSVMISDDFSHIYFQSKAQLVPGAGKSGDNNLYVLSNGDIHFVADPNEPDVLNWGRRPRLSADGNALLFLARPRPAMTADAVAANCPSLAGTGGMGDCEELYRYDDRDQSLECVSCRQGGTTSNNAGSPGASFTSFGLSGNGAVAAFATAEPLVAGDVNSGTDLYEWRNGILHLLSDGVSAFPTNASAPQVFGLDASGGNILFGLVPPGGSLTGFEHDRVLNLYDARVGGGFQPPAPVDHCEGDSCQGPLQSPPAFRQPASSGQSNGNVRGGVARCPKGSQRRHGRCARNHAHKHKKRGMKHHHRLRKEIVHRVQGGSR